MRDIAQQRFGRLVAIKVVDKDRKHHLKWLCQCDCGNTSIVASTSLITGKTRSCGCFQQEARGKCLIKHNMANKTPLYRIWTGMKNRCYNTKDKKYHIWGGKGIKVCSEWKKDFLSFYNWANTAGYYKGLQIDRINPDGNYEPNNCQWLTQHAHARKTQNDKKRCIA